MAWSSAQGNCTNGSNGKNVVGQEFVGNEPSHCVYFKQKGNNFVTLVLYVNDIILISDC